MSRRLLNVSITILFVLLSGVCQAQEEASLREAIVRGDIESVQALLDAGVAPNTIFERDNMPLHVAVMRDRDDIIRLLLERGADPLHENRFGETPLDLVFTRGSAKSFWPLYRATESMNAEVAMQIPVMLDEAVSRDHRALLEALLDPAQALPKSSGVELNLFFKAAEWGSVSVLQYFSEGDRDLRQVDAASQWTALHFLAQGGHRDGLQWILAQGAAVNVRDARGMTPLHMAVYMGHAEVAEGLLKAGAEVDAADENGRTPLHIAAYQGYGALIRVLLLQGASPERKTLAGHTPMDIVRTRRFTALRTLFPFDSGTPSALSDEFAGSLLALREAIQGKNSQRALGLLASNDALTLDGADRYGVSLLHYASDVGDRAILDVLLDRGVDVNLSDAQSGWSPLMYAVANGHIEATELLIAAGADVNHQDAMGWTALHLSEFHEHRGLRRLLKAAGAQEDMGNELGHTAEMLAQRGRQYRADQYGKLVQP